MFRLPPDLCDDSDENEGSIITSLISQLRCVCPPAVPARSSLTRALLIAIARAESAWTSPR